MLDQLASSCLKLGTTETCIFKFDYCVIGGRRLRFLENLYSILVSQIRFNPLPVAFAESSTIDKNFCQITVKKKTGLFTRVINIVVCSDQ